MKAVEDIHLGERERHKEDTHGQPSNIRVNAEEKYRHP
jgi:hypothetical protein